MSPLRIERGNSKDSVEDFVVPDGGKFTQKLAGGRRINFYGSILGGYMEDIIECRNPDKKTITRLTMFDNPVTISFKLKHEKNLTRFTITGILF